MVFMLCFLKDITKCNLFLHYSQLNLKNNWIRSEFEKWRAIRASVDGVLALLTCLGEQRWQCASMSGMLVLVACQRVQHGWGGWGAYVGGILEWVACFNYCYCYI